MQKRLLHPPPLTRRRLQLLSLIFIYLVGLCQSKKLNVIFIMVDDLGFNDVGFRGSAQIPTPNIDALAYSGVILNRYYVNHLCTPSRSALLTGKYPIHTGMQHSVIISGEPRGLPLDLKLLPQYLNDLGYTSHMAGKWHLGHWKKVYTPLYRGFSSHVGFWTARHDYNDHTSLVSKRWGLDMRNGTEVAYDLHGQSITDIITTHSLNVIAQHNPKKGPLFLYVSHAAVHSANLYNPLPAKDDIVNKLSNITKYKRRRYAALVSDLDDSVGKIVEQLWKYKLLQKSIIIFSTDNGGAPQGLNLNYGSNYPLRGVKWSLFEGGVRGAAFLWTLRLRQRPRLAEQTMHIVDWLPTLVEAAGGKAALANLNEAKLDGISIWQALCKNEISPRKSILHNIDEIWGSSALTVGDWKLVNGTVFDGKWDGWYGPEGWRDPHDYNWEQVFDSVTGRIMKTMKMLPKPADQIRLREKATIHCQEPKSKFKEAFVCKPLIRPCLFNVREDPCERHNVASLYPKVLESMLEELHLINATAVPATNRRTDNSSDPRFWNYTWTNFGDYPKPMMSRRHKNRKHLNTYNVKHPLLK